MSGISLHRVYLSVIVTLVKIRQYFRDELSINVVAKGLTFFFLAAYSVSTHISHKPNLFKKTRTPKNIGQWDLNLKDPLQTIPKMCE